MSDDWKDLFCNAWFVKLEDYGKRWGIAHKSFDGKTTAEIFDSDLNRLIETWERLLLSLKNAQCPHCGYTHEDKLIHGDHQICEERNSVGSN